MRPFPSVASPSRLTHADALRLWQARDVYRVYCALRAIKLCYILAWGMVIGVHFGLLMGLLAGGLAWYGLRLLGHLLRSRYAWFTHFCQGDRP
jgi:hypothetical protein